MAAELIQRRKQLPAITLSPMSHEGKIWVQHNLTPLSNVFSPEMTISAVVSVNTPLRTLRWCAMAAELMIAAQDGNSVECARLLEANADPDLQDPVSTPEMAEQIGDARLCADRSVCVQAC